MIKILYFIAVCIISVSAHAEYVYTQVILTFDNGLILNITDIDNSALSPNGTQLVLREHHANYEVTGYDPALTPDGELQISRLRLVINDIADLNPYIDWFDFRATQDVLIAGLGPDTITIINDGPIRDESIRIIFMGYPILNETLTLTNVQVYGESFSEVPVPAAGWLFMSALVGLAGKKRLSRR